MGFTIGPRTSLCHQKILASLKKRPYPITLEGAKTPVDDENKKHYFSPVPREDRIKLLQELALSHRRNKAVEKRHGRKGC